MLSNQLHLFGYCDRNRNPTAPRMTPAEKIAMMKSIYSNDRKLSVAHIIYRDGKNNAIAIAKELKVDYKRVKEIVDEMIEAKVVVVANPGYTPTDVAFTKIGRKLMEVFR